MQDSHTSLRMPQIPAASGRLVFWERTRPWSRIFLNRLCQAETRPGMDSALLAEQAVFVSSLEELRAAVESHPASFVFAEATASHFRELLGRVPHFRRAMPRLRVAVACFELPELPMDESSVLDSLFREAGAVAVLSTQRDLLAMIPVALSHFADLPPCETGWREVIEQRLPWRNIHLETR